MEKSTTFQFDEFKAGYFLAWNITSQCWNTGRIQISCGGKTLVDASKSSRDTKITMLAQGSDTISADTVKVTVTINGDAQELKNSKSGAAIMDHTGRKVGYVYDVCIEDGTDNDYNDIYINLVGWERKG